MALFSPDLGLEVQGWFRTSGECSIIIIILNVSITLIARGFLRGTLLAKFIDSITKLISWVCMSLLGTESIMLLLRGVTTFLSF